MKLALDYRLSVGDDVIMCSALARDVEAHLDNLKDLPALEGSLVISIDSEEAAVDYEDPVVRLAYQWIRRLQWVIGGDTETFALRNSEHCYAFEPTGDSVEVSFFEGSESEVDEYVIEPTKIRLEPLVDESIRLVDQLVGIIRTVNPELLESDEDCKDLATSLEETRTAWHDHQVRQRR